MLLTLYLTLTFLGLALAYFGKRGRKIDDHPVCAACGFDLSGRPKGVNRCSECGKTIYLPTAIRIGNRRPRTGLIWVGFSLATVCAFASAGIVYAGITGWNYLPYAPTWICLQQAHHGSAPQQTAAFAELRGRLGANAAKSIATKALAMQADVESKWDPRWGDLVEVAHDKGTIGPEQWQQYLGHAPVVKVAMRPQVELTKGIFIRQTTASRIGSPVSSGYSPRFIANTKFTARCGAIAQSIPGKSFEIEVSGEYGLNDFRLPPSFTASLGPGRKNIELECSWEVHPVSSTSPIGTSKATQTFAVNILPEGVPDVRIVNPPGLAGVIDKCFSVQSLSIKDNSWVLNVHAELSPLNLAFDVYAKTEGGAEEKWTSMYFPAQSSFGWGTNGTCSMELANANTLELIFRPSTEAASNTLDIFEIFGGEIRKKVPVQK